MQYVRFISAFLLYAIIDIAWNLSPPARGMYENFYESSGHDAVLDQFGRPLDELGGLVILAGLVFFLLIGLANSVLAIESALREGAADSREKQFRVRLCGLCDLRGSNINDDQDVARRIGAHRHSHRWCTEPDNIFPRNLGIPAASPAQRLKSSESGLNDAQCGLTSII